MIIAATAATLFLAGCATQGTDNASGSRFTTGNSCGGPAPVANACKGMTSCKGKRAAKRHHKRRHKAKAKAAKTDAAATTTTTTGGATQ
jgi:hypothetical protein